MAPLAASPALRRTPWFSKVAGVAWLCVPLAIYLLVLTRLWFNAPVWDDYLAILYDARVQLETQPLDMWWRFLLRPHNEHRIAVDRLVAWAFAKGLGHIDFRAIMALGALSVFGGAVLLWAQFRRAVPALVFLAVGFVLFQWSWFEAALTSSALVNLTVLTFSLACLYFAVLPGKGAAVACVAFGVLAMGSQANGLFAFPIAAAGCLHIGKRRRALALGGLTIAAWTLYFHDFHGNPTHPSLLYALDHPLDAARFFLTIVGGVVPGVLPSTVTGLVFLAMLLWLARTGIAQRHVPAVLWVAFILASAFAATVARIGLGVVYTSRFAIYSSALAAILLLLACAATAPWSSMRTGLVVGLAAVASAAVSWMTWPQAVMYSVNGHRLAKAVPASPDVQVQPYFGMFFPVEAQSAEILAKAESLGIYEPPRVVVHRTQVVAAASVPSEARIAGSFDNFVVDGNKVTVGGWTDIPATIPGRMIAVVATTEASTAGAVHYDDRRDVAMMLRDPLMEFAGFHVALEYPSEAQARSAAASMCIVVSAPGRGEAVLPRKDVACRPGRK